MKNIKK